MRHLFDVGSTMMTARWGILATGQIAHSLADGIAASEESELVAVGSRTREAANAFAKARGVRAHSTYDGLLADPAVDVVYIATPHPQHAEWTIKALEAGKAVLCEKPMGVSHPEVMAMVETAHFHNRFLMEAFMYRAHPQTAKVMELVRDGAIGDVRQISASHGFASTFNPQSRLHSNELAGGGILDVGCYPVSMARLVAGEEPDEVVGFANLGETGVDRWASALLRFPSGLIAQVATGVSLNLDNTVSIFGSKGAIHIDSPWFGAGADGRWSFQLTRGGKGETVSGRAKQTYVLEVDAVARALAAGQVESPCMTWQDSLGNARVLDRWRHAVGVSYEFEKEERQTVPVDGRPLAIRRRAMRYGEVSGLDKPVSRLVMGCDNQPSPKHAAVMFDHYYEYGGNTFDTAHIYGDGAMERLLGGWIANRGVRDNVVIIGKGAHTPDNFPKRVAEQLALSLQRLRVDCVDLYFLHRDNEDIPVGEWMDALNAEKDAGRIKALGASNWSLHRVRQANAYAAKNGLAPFAAVSNNFSLARLVDPVWPGCVAASTSHWRDWLAAEQMALFPWSSQARGFFTPRFNAVRAQTRSMVDAGFGDQPSDAEMRRCWFAEDNFERRERAVALAQEKGVLPIQIALAYVLAQPFPVFALIGPRALSETRESVVALKVKLTERERRWLNLETNTRQGPASSARRGNDAPP